MAIGMDLIIGMKWDPGNIRRRLGQNRARAAWRFSPLLVIFALLPLTSCSLALQIALFNNSGEDVTIELWHENIALKPAQSAQFKYPGASESWQIHLSTTECRYEYAVPQGYLPHIRNADSYGPLKVELEKDFAIYVLPPGSKDIALISDLAALQQDGFPLHPISKACR
jgi:hypothetical protein